MGIQQKCARYHKEAEKGQKTLKKKTPKNKKAAFILDLQILCYSMANTLQTSQPMQIYSGSRRSSL